MNYWNKIPLFRLLLPFICGSVSALYCEGLRQPVIFMLPITIGIFSIAFFLKEFYSEYKNRLFFGCLIHFMMFLFGALITTENIHTPITQKNSENRERHYYFGHVLEPLTAKEKTYRALVELSAEKIGATWKNKNEKILIYFKKDSISKWPEYGDGLIIFTRLQPIEGPANPYEYDYKKQAALKGIYFRAFLNKNEWRKAGRNKSGTVMKYALQLRNIVFSQLKKYLPDKNEYGVAEALLVGSTEDLDRQLSQAYSTAGVVHILSVSGLHIGLVYLVFNSLLFFMNNKRVLKISKFLILILFLWSYACISGLSPSVLRAAMMLSLVIIGKALERNTNTYNTLAASAFVLLVLYPPLISNLGFQLSYLAVLGILLLHPIIYKQLQTEYYLPDKVWQMTSVSLSAQAFTLPLILFHFHQMPNYFILANLIVIPLATILLFSGIALVMAMKWTWLCSIIAQCMHCLLKLLNTTVQEIEAWPYALTQNITICIWDVLFLYAALICFLLFYFNKKVSQLFCCFCLLLLFQANQCYAAVAASQQKKIIVYSISKLQAIDFIDGNNAILLADSEITSNPAKLLFHIQGNRMALRIKEAETFQITMMNTSYKKPHWHALNNFIQFYNTKLFIANSNASKIIPSASKKNIFRFYHHPQHL